jgi:nucleoside-diphosphate-sugar epimerase
VLLTGASGYLGRHVLARMHTDHIPCVPTSLGGAVGEPCDLLDVASVRVLLDRTRPSVVIHCAAVVPKSMSDYSDTQAAGASVGMLRSLADNTSAPIVLASSMTVYGTAPECPVDEESPLQPASEYARGKWAAEQLLFQRRGQGDVILRLPGLFGLPRRTGVLYNAAKAFLTLGHFEPAPSIEPWAAITAQDGAEYLVRAATARSDRPPQAMNVGYEGEFSVVAAVAQIASAAGVEWRPTLAGGAAFSMRLERLQSRYGALAVTFRQRLEAFVEAVRHDLALEPAPRR